MASDPNKDFKVVIFFSIKCLKNGTIESYFCNGRLIGSPVSVTGVIDHADFKGTPLFDIECLRNDAR